MQKAFDIFVFPLLEEGLGSTLLDVMQLNVPIIATNVGGIPELITDQVTGLLIEPKDAQAIKTAIETLLTNSELKDQLTHNAFIKSQEFSPNIMAEKYLTIYNGILRLT
ncbi:hypothetical protein FACS1894103_7160 [Campylobacterota bacterium]|nr:hypothetical protein FACS1894103_7160 [Campylobacterota bacterium]